MFGLDGPRVKLVLSRITSKMFLKLIKGPWELISLVLIAVPHATNSPAVK